MLLRPIDHVQLIDLYLLFFATNIHCEFRSSMYSVILPTRNTTLLQFAALAALT